MEKNRTKNAMKYLEQRKVDAPQSKHNNITVKKSPTTVATSLSKEESTTLELVASFLNK